jgi:6-phosphogluconolactonase
MKNLTRRSFIKTASAATLIAAASPDFAATHRQRVFVASNTPNGILAYDWDSATGDLTAAGVAAEIPIVDYVIFSPRKDYLFAACEVREFEGKHTGEVASYSVSGGKLTQLTARNSAGPGTCQVALDHTGRVLISADYGGGSAASFLVTDGKLSEPVWTEHFTGHGPNPMRQRTPHAHFASFAPNNRFAYINDLGLDMIHIYRVDTKTAMLTPAGGYHGKPGVGCRTLHFHPNGHTAYCMNELSSTVDILEWNANDGSLTRKSSINLVPEGAETHGCDTVISRDGKSVYFANRGNNSIYFYRADYKTGDLTKVDRIDCGGKTPRFFTLDPTERWVLVANQDSSLISVFKRNTSTGDIAKEGKTVAAATPMCILFE